MIYHSGYFVAENNLLLTKFSDRKKMLTLAARDRDTGKQERHKVDELDKYFDDMLR